MYLASNVGRWSTTVIGRFYGGRDHSTVIHSIQRIEAMREIEPDLDALLSDLKTRLQSAVEEAAKPDAPCPIIRMPTSERLNARLFAKEIAAQVGELLREELRRIHEVRDFRAASQERNPHVD
jgi:hypothetical protein